MTLSADVTTAVRVGREASAAGVRWPLAFFVITLNPSDYPGMYVVRAWAWVGGAFGVAVQPAPAPCVFPRAVTYTLAAARAAIPPDCVCFLRHPGDDPVVVETWV